MRLYEFVPICDHDIDDESLIERAFGPGFCVVDETRQLLTTVHNQNLLLRAKALLDESVPSIVAESTQAWKCCAPKPQSSRNGTTNGR